MSSEKSEAIVIRAVPWSETSLVVTLLTKEFGTIAAIAKGARRLRSPFESALDLLTHSHVVFIAKSGDTLDLLTEAKLIRRFRSGQRALLPLYCGYYVAELLATLTENHQVVPDLFELSNQTLVDLDRGLAPSSVILRFELHFLRLLGLLPSLEQCAGCGHAIQLDDTIALGVNAGGALCDACLPGHRHVVRMRRAPFDVFGRFANSDWRGTLELIESPMRGELRFVIERFLSVLADRRLRLLDFLDELKY